MQQTIEKNESSGNTMTEQQEQKEFKINAKNVILTVNEKSFEHLDDIVKYLMHYKANNYILVCSHDKPKLHYHIYAQYENARKFDSRYLYGAHVEKCFGSAQANVNYCKGLDDKHISLGIKCEVVYENGQMKERGGRRIKDIQNMTDDEVLEMDANMYTIAMKIRGARKIKCGQWHKQIKVIWIWGPSGAGKSKMAEEKIIENGYDEFSEIKHIGEFWHGIFGSEVTGAAIYDDFRDSHMKASEFVHLIDYNIHHLNFKGGSCENKLSLIVITSIQDPTKIYPNASEPIIQWVRRMEIIKIHTDQDNKSESCEVDHDVLVDCASQRDSDVTCPDDSESKAHEQDVLQHVDLSSLQWV